MDSIGGIDSQPGLGGAAPTRGSNQMGKDEFLKLLMAQLGNQDPTAPVDSQAFVAQLAQFASLEVAQNTNSHLESLLIAQTAGNQTALTSFVGKDIVFRTDRIILEGGRAAESGAHLGADAESVTAVVTDSGGKTIRTLQLGKQPGGPLVISWDGRDDRGSTVAPGEYKLRVTALGADGKSVGVEQRGSGHVSGVAFENGIPVIRLGNASVRVPDVVEIKERTAP